VSFEAIHRVLSALEARGCRPRKTRTGWEARCPAHDDRKPSLSVAEGQDGRVLLTCHAGCTVEAITAALGMEVKDLFPTETRSTEALHPMKTLIPEKTPPQNGKAYPTANEALKAYGLGKPVKWWTYYREGDSNPCMVVARWNTSEGKSIRPVFRDSAGWKQGALPAPRPLYRLPELLASPPGTPVVITEGEKAADAAAKCGLVAVTSSGGANAASKSDWRPLRGRRVIILPDNDPAGERYAQDVTDLCQKAGAASVKIIRLAAYADGFPEGGDIADVVIDRHWLGLPLGENASLEDLGKWILERAADLEDELEPQEPPLTWKPYPVESLPRVFQDYVTAAAEAMGCDPSFIALPLLVAAASAIGTTRSLTLKSGWQVPAILWGVIAAESGTLKSPAFHTAIEPVEHYQRTLAKQYDAEAKDHEIKVLEYEVALSQWKRERNGEPPRKPEPPKPRRVLTQNTTIEAVAGILKDNPRGLLLAPDELTAWLCGFDRYANSKGAEAAQWLSLYHGRGLTVDRKTSGTLHIPMAAVSIVGTIQPGVLRRALGFLNRENGLAARFLIVKPSQQTKRWTEDEIPDGLMQAVENIFQRLYTLEHDIGPDGDPVPRIVRLSREAKQAYVNFYDTHAKELADLSGDLAAAFAKLEELPARLALVIHFVRWASGESVNPEVIDAETMNNAIALTEWHKHETRRVYDWLDEVTASDEDAALLDWITRRGGVVTVRDVTHGIWRFRGKPEDAETALQTLVDKGFGTWETIASSQKGGRPKTVFRVMESASPSPKLHEKAVLRSYGDGDVGDEATPQPPTGDGDNDTTPKGGSVQLDVSEIGEYDPKREMLDL
jgi:hypothetical protein